MECVCPLAAELGEGPVWWRGALWFTDINGCRLYRFDPAGNGMEVWFTPSPVGFLAPRGEDRFILGAKSGLLGFDPGSGSFSLLRVVEPDEPGNRLNDGGVDGKGRLWFGSMDDGEAQPSGRLYRFDGRGLAPVDDGYVITNGPAFSPDGRTLYHTDTLKKTIYAFDVSDDGDLGNKRVFVQIEEGAGHPDGCTMDSAGCLWTGLFGGWAVRRYAPDGALMGEVRFPCANVTKIAFGGEDLRTVYATTAWKGLDAAARAAQPLAGGLFCFRADVPGLPQQAVRV